jgi:aminopeptidase N
MLAGGGPYADPVRETAAASVRALQSEEPAPAELRKLWQEVQQLQKKAQNLEKQLDEQKKKAVPVK